MATTALKFDTKRLTELAANLGTLSGDAIGAVVVTSLNDVIEPVYELARNRMIDGINLNDAYLRRRMSLRKATSSRPEASITAIGQQTQLSQFRPIQETRANNLGARGKRTGNAALGIPAGRRADRITVSVAPGTRVGFEHAFSIVRNGSALTDSDGNKLMFTRSAGAPKKAIRTLLGPSVYQLFAYQLRGALAGDAEELLAEELAAQIEASVQKALK